MIRVSLSVGNISTDARENADRWTSVGKALAIGGLLTCALSACQTAAQTKAASLSASLSQINEQARKCTLQNAENPDYQELAIRMHINPTQSSPTLSQLSDKTFPSSHDIQALLGWHADNQKCRQFRIAAYSKVYPDVVPVVAESYAATDRILVQLVRGQLPWGQANQELRDAAVAHRQKIAVVNERTQTALQRQHSTEIEQQRATAAALAQWSYQQQLLNQNQQYLNTLNRPVNTSCSRFGYTTNCTTH